jgi:hypothetical protein
MASHAGVETKRSGHCESLTRVVLVVAGPPPEDRLAIVILCTSITWSTTAPAPAAPLVADFDSPLVVGSISMLAKQRTEADADAVSSRS